MGRRERIIQDDISYEHPAEPIGKRLGRFLTLMGIIFALSGGVVVTQRLSQDALALIVGLSCGIATMLPVLILGGLWLKRELGQRESDRQPAAQFPSQPQIVVVAPPAYPGYGQGYGQPALPAQVPSQWQSTPAQREFKIVGGID
jgi:hypothetical protein